MLPLVCWALMFGTVLNVRRLAPSEGIRNNENHKCHDRKPVLDNRIFSDAPLWVQIDS